MCRYRILNFVWVLVDWILFSAEDSILDSCLWDQVLTMLVGIGELLSMSLKCSCMRGDDKSLARPTS